MASRDVVGRGTGQDTAAATAERAGAGTGRSAWGAGEGRLRGRMQEEIGRVGWRLAECEEAQVCGAKLGRA
jgi:hypothetical protein